MAVPEKTRDIAVIHATQGVVDEAIAATKAYNAEIYRLVSTSVPGATAISFPERIGNGDHDNDPLRKLVNEVALLLDRAGRALPDELISH